MTTNEKLYKELITWDKKMLIDCLMDVMPIYMAYGIIKENEVNEDDK